MPETTASAIDKSLEVLLQAERDFPGYSLDICSGYVSTDGEFYHQSGAESERAMIGQDDASVPPSHPHRSRPYR